MNIKHFYIFFWLFLAFTTDAWALTNPTSKREVRGVWLTTINGLDWPKTKATSDVGIKEQKEELCKILDKLQQAHFNTIFLQTRIRSTVIYPSAIEPWDACLTGHVGRSPNYDPLAFAVEECHKRGMQLHAWIVAFPGHDNRTATALGAKAMQKRVPSLCMRSNDSWMLNPGVPETATYLANICKEITENYDIDGIHLDYVRYPESGIKFSDEHTYKKYGKGQKLKDWRRENVTRVVRKIHTSVKSLKPWIWMSCSPVGKYDDLPRQSSYGWNAYNTVCQDAQKWLKDNIMDMLVPMMYFNAGRHFYPFALDWKECAYGKPIVNGLAVYKLDKHEGNWNLDVIEKEVNFSRSIQSGGQAYFRTQFILSNCKKSYDFMKDDLYESPALLPAMDFQHKGCPSAPRNLTIRETPNGFQLKWEASKDSTCLNKIMYNIYASSTFPVDTENPQNLICTYWGDTTFSINSLRPRTLLQNYAITAINRYGNESIPLISDTIATQCSTVKGGEITLLNNGNIKLPETKKAKQIQITDMTIGFSLTIPYEVEINLQNLPCGYYKLQALEKKRTSHVLGYYIKR